MWISSYEQELKRKAVCGSDSFEILSGSGFTFLHSFLWKQNANVTILEKVILKISTTIREKKTINEDFTSTIFANEFQLPFSLFLPLFASLSLSLANIYDHIACIKIQSKWRGWNTNTNKRISLSVDDAASLNENLYQWIRFHFLSIETKVHYTRSYSLNHCERFARSSLPARFESTLKQRFSTTGKHSP